jgi:hypothetical protein
LLGEGKNGVKSDYQKEQGKPGEVLKNPQGKIRFLKKNL